MSKHLKLAAYAVLVAGCSHFSSAQSDALVDSAEAAGMSYTALVNRIVQLGLSYMPEWRMFEA